MSLLGLPPHTKRGNSSDSGTVCPPSDGACRIVAAKTVAMKKSFDVRIARESESSLVDDVLNTAEVASKLVTECCIRKRGCK